MAKQGVFYDPTQPAQPWWVAVYVRSRNGTVDDFERALTIVRRFQAASKGDACVRAGRLSDWRLVSVAQEVLAVY